MPFIIDEDDEEDFLPDLLQVVEKNQYISNSVRAAELFAKFLKKQENENIRREVIVDMIEAIFARCSTITLENELDLYEQFLKLTAKLSIHNKLRLLRGKTIISLGGKFSAGKSSFLNSIIDIGQALPDSQNPTTSLATYILKGDNFGITAHCYNGESVELTKEEFKALTHEFDAAYQIGFAPFIESTIIQSDSFDLDADLAFLDTPGYTKYDGEMSAKHDSSDRKKAYEQLNVSDYLIWLVDINNGELTLDDIQFIDSLNITTPILIVFNKADLETESNIKLIVEKARYIVERNLSTPCFGVTAYSSHQKKEYNGNLIASFFAYAAQNKGHSNDLEYELTKLQAELHQSMTNLKEEAEKTANGMLQFIRNTSGVFEIQSITKIWKEKKAFANEMQRLIIWYEKICKDMNNKVGIMIGDK